MTEQEFVEAYAQRSNRTVAEVLARNVVLRCHCDAWQCQGWAVVENRPDAIATHRELYGEPEARK